MYLNHGQAPQHSDYHCAENLCQEWSLIILISKGTKVASAWVKGEGCFISLSVAVEQRLFILLYTYIYIWMGLQKKKKFALNP
jgi:hypothetical protein